MATILSAKCCLCWYSFGKDIYSFWVELHYLWTITKPILRLVMSLIFPLSFLPSQVQIQKKCVILQTTAPKCVYEIRSAETVNTHAWSWFSFHEQICFSSFYIFLPSFHLVFFIYHILYDPWMCSFPEFIESTFNCSRTFIILELRWNYSYFYSMNKVTKAKKQKQKPNTYLIFCLYVSIQRCHKLEKINKMGVFT